MCKNSHHQQRSVMLPASVLDGLKDMPAGALKVFIYLCSCNEGQPIAVSIPTLAAATGGQRRSLISALKTLREHQLITSISGIGNQPNQYSIPLPKRQETAAPPTPTNVTTPPGPGLKQATPPEATPTRAITPEPIPPRSSEVSKKLQELLQLLARLGFPDATDLNVKSLLAASVDPDKPCADADLMEYLDRLLARLRPLARKDHKFHDFRTLCDTVHKLYGIR
jgi:hypothetical protein